MQNALRFLMKKISFFSIDIFFLFCLNCNNLLFYLTDPEIHDLTVNDLTENDLTEIMKVYMLVCPTCSQWCEPYSELACIVSTFSMGFQLATPSNSGYEFAGGYGTKGYGITG